MGKKILNFFGYFILLLTAVAVLVYYAPQLIQNIEFTKGLLCSVLLLSFFYLLLYLKSYFFDSKKDSPSIQWPLILTFIVVVCIGMISLVAFLKENRLTQERIAHQKSLLQKEVLTLQKNQVLSTTKEDLIATIQKELSSDSNKISEHSIQAIAKLSAAYEPYEKMESESMTTFRKSPERGILLLDLVQLSLDSSSLAKIIRNTTFAYAEIDSATFRNINLSNIDLTGCHLRGADLSFANLQNAKMQGADLRGANLRGAQLSKAKMKRSKLSWSQLNNAVLHYTNLDGSDLNNANLNATQLNNATIQYAKLQSIKIQKADLTNINLYQSDLTKTDMSHSIVRNANLRNTTWTDASLKGTDLTGAVLRGATFQYTNLDQTNLNDVFVMGEDWFEKLDHWKIVGTKYIKEKYKKQKEPSFLNNYILKPR